MELRNRTCGSGRMYCSSQTMKSSNSGKINPRPPRSAMSPFWWFSNLFRTFLVDTVTRFLTSGFELVLLPKRVCFKKLWIGSKYRTSNKENIYNSASFDQLFHCLVSNSIENMNLPCSSYSSWDVVIVLKTRICVFWKEAYSQNFG